jgi:hypothetical protein
MLRVLALRRSLFHVLRSHLAGPIDSGATGKWRRN